MSLVVVAIEVLEHLRIDDPIGAVPVHGICGIWGTWSLGLFACGQYGASGAIAPDNSAKMVLKGLFYGGGTDLFIAQVTGNAIVVGATFAAALILMFGLKAAGILRLSREGELEGLDVHEHGIPAYPEFALLPSALPGGHGGDSSHGLSYSAGHGAEHSSTASSPVLSKKADN